MTTTPQLPTILLQHHLKALRLPVFLREHAKTANRCAQEKADYATFLLQLAEMELIEREQKGTQRRIHNARFPANKTLDDFDFLATPSLNKKEVIELTRCEWIDKKENVIFLGNPGTGKTHLAVALGLAACGRGYHVRFVTAAGLVNLLAEARNEKGLLKLQAQLAKLHLLIVDELGYLPLSKTGAELLFEVLSQRYERGSVLITSNLPFEEWTQILNSERLTGALLDRLTHRVHILPIEGNSYRLVQSRNKKKKSKTKEEAEEPNPKTEEKTNA